MNWAGLLQALHNKCGFEAAESTPSEKQLRLLGRAPQGRMGDMLLLIHTLETNAATSSGWSTDISKKYLLRKGKVVFGWRFIFQANAGTIAEHLPEITRVINQSAQSARREVTEVPLLGASANRNEQSANGKGAGLMGKVKVGPLLKGA